MQRPDARALAAECLPGEGDVQLELLGQGLVSDTYRARRDGRLLVLRVARQPSPAGYAAHEFERRLVERAAACGLAPPVVYSDARRGILALEWLPGQTWKAAAVGKPAGIGAAADLIRRVQALDAPLPVLARTPRDWVDHYRRVLGASTGPGPDGLSPPAERVLRQLAALLPVAPVICHSDLHRLNVLTLDQGSPPRDVLLDWEYAHLAEPGWDLAGWSANNDFSAAQSRALLCAYGGAEPDAMQWRRFALLRWVFDYVCVLWIRVYRASIQPVAPALGERAALLETRLHAAVCGKLATSDEPYLLET